MLTELATIVTQVWSWLATLSADANLQPILLIAPAFGVAGATIGLFKRATRIGGRRR